MTYNGSIMKGYIDGIIKKELSDASISNTVLNTNLVLGLSDILPSVRAYDGKISDLRVYNRALNDDEIKLLYDSFKPATSASDLNKGLVGHWMLDSENGAKDLTPNANHGTVSGTTLTTDRKGRSGGATDFDGTDDYVEIPHNANQLLTTGGSISAWINPKSLGGGNYGRVIDKASGGAADNGFFLAMIETNRVYFRIGNNTNYNIVTTTNSVPFNIWTYVTVIWNSTGWVKIYINGVLNNEGQGANPNLITTTNAMRIGNRATATDRAFNGDISGVKIYNRALTAEEAKLLYDQYKPKEASTSSLSKGLVLDMPLTTKHMKSSTIVADRTPYTNDGTINGATVGTDSTSFDGTNDYINLGNSNTLKPTEAITVGAWVYKENWSTLVSVHQMVISCTEDGGYELYFSTDGYFRLFIYINGAYRYSGTTYTSLSSGWHYVSGTYDGRYVKLYVDGVLKNTYDAGGNYPIHYTYANSLIVGAEASSGSSSSGNYFNGSISGVKIYNRALSESEVKLLYEKGRN